MLLLERSRTLQVLNFSCKWKLVASLSVNHKTQQNHQQAIPSHLPSHLQVIRWPNRWYSQARVYFCWRNQWPRQQNWSTWTILNSGSSLNWSEFPNISFLVPSPAQMLNKKDCCRIAYFKLKTQQIYWLLAKCNHSWLQAKPTWLLAYFLNLGAHWSIFEAGFHLVSKIFAAPVCLHKHSW